jgi:hypothetical protein
VLLIADFLMLAMSVFLEFFQSYDGIELQGQNPWELVCKSIWNYWFSSLLRSLCFSIATCQKILQVCGPLFCIFFLYERWFFIFEVWIFYFLMRNWWVQVFLWSRFLKGQDLAGSLPKSIVKLPYLTNL